MCLVAEKMSEKMNVVCFCFVKLCAVALCGLLAVGGLDSAGVREAVEECGESWEAGGGGPLLHTLLHHHKLLLVGETAMQSALQGVSGPPSFAFTLLLLCIPLYFNINFNAKVFHLEYKLIYG